MSRIAFYYDIVSPYSYFAYMTLKRYVNYWDVTEFALHPVFLGGIFQAAGNTAPLDVPNKRKWIAGNQQMQSKHHGFDFELPQRFPVLTLNVMRFLREVKDAQPEALVPATEQFWHALFTAKDEKVDITDTSSWPLILNGVMEPDDITRIFQVATTNENKGRLKREAAELANDGGFGVPWFKVTKSDGTFNWFWGSDKFDLVGYFLDKPYQGPFPSQ